jgi:hypothetical protein
MAKSDRAFRALARSQPNVVAELLRVLAPHSLPPGAAFTLDDLAPTQVDALPYAMDSDCIARVGNDEIRHIEFQGYRDDGFSERCVWYHVGTALPYRGKRRVRSVAVWLMPLPKGQTRNIMRHADISVRVKTIVLPNVPAAKLLANPKTACFAAGANAGSWSDRDLCMRVAISLRENNASWPERHLAVVAALMQKRYDAMVTAMEHMQMEPVIIEDLVKYGEDRGFDRGAAHERVRMYDDMFEVRLGRPLTPSEHDMLSRSITTVTSKQLLDMMFNASPKTLEAWLADPTTK